MATETDKTNLIENTFRRASLTSHGIEYIESSRFGSILGQMGQPYNQKELADAIAKLDPSGTGKLDHDQYHTLCKQFVKDPAACAKYAGDEFSFKHLINLTDFAKP